MIEVIEFSVNGEDGNPQGRYVLSLKTDEK